MLRKGSAPINQSKSLSKQKISIATLFIMSKSKAILKFLSALSSQVPKEALGVLLKPENDALIVFLNGSIEALPMGSPIRKEVDSNIQEYIVVLRKELETRKREYGMQDKGTEMEMDIHLPSHGKIPLSNSILYQMAFDDSKGQDQERYLCSQFVSGETILKTILSKQEKDTATIQDITRTIQHAFVAQQIYNLDEYIQMFYDAIVAHDETLNVVSEIKQFLRIMLLSRDTLKCSFDTTKASVVGGILGKLISIAINNPEEYYVGLLAQSNNNKDDESSDDETLNIVKKKKMTKDEVITMRRDVKRDATSVLCTVYSSFNSKMEGKLEVAHLTIGIINLFIATSGSNINSFKQSTDCLLEALELTNVVDKCEIPSATLLQDPTKRCNILTTWAEQILIRASLQKQERESDSMNSDLVYVMDTKAQDVSIESDSDDGEENDDDSESSSSDKPNDDGEPLFVLDTQKSEVTFESGEDTETDDRVDMEENDYQDIERTITKAASKSLLRSVPEDEEVDEMAIPPCVKAVPESPKRRTRSNSSLSNVSNDTPGRLTRSRARGMSSSSVDSITSAPMTKQVSKQTTRPNRKRSASAASDAETSGADAAPTRRSSRRAK